MKLLNETSKYYFLTSTLIFFLGGGALSLAIPYIINLETDESLYDFKKTLTFQLSEMDSLPEEVIILDNVIEVREIFPLSTPEFEEPLYKDTLRLNVQDGEYEPFRKMVFDEIIHDKYYRIAINHSKLDYEELITTLGTAILIILALILLGITLFNTFLSRRLWQPFYRIIRDIKNFTFDSDSPITPSNTSIEEFNVLHQAIRQMTNKAMDDYHSLKQFTENASHEIQNPLAIIKSNVELLIQNEDREQSEWMAIRQIHQAASRLSKLNEALILLTRIENRQFSDKQKLNFELLVENKLDQFEPFIRAKKLAVYTDLSQVSHYMDPTLSDVLLNNLFGNAIKHNKNGGSISVILRQSHLTISNTGTPLRKDFSQLLSRFTKDVDAKHSLGLGLSIVKEICVIYDLIIKYKFENEQHKISIIF